MLIDLNENITLLLGILLDMGIFCIYPLSVARANDVTDTNNNIVEISRTLLFIYATGSFLAPLVIGICFTNFAYNSIFILYLILSSFLFAYALTREKVPDEKLTVFVEVPPLAADILAEMDPRQDKEWVNKKSEHIKN